jgi:C-terminal processing protease CtpA/Prc
MGLVVVSLGVLWSAATIPGCNLYGLLIKKLGEIPPSYIVSKVWKESAAFAAGIKQGDAVEKVDGVEIFRIPAKQLQSLMDHEGVIQLSISRDDHSRLFTLKSASLPDPD